MSFQALDQFYGSEQELLGYEQEVKRTKGAAAILKYAQDAGRQAAQLEIAQRLLSIGMDQD